MERCTCVPCTTPACGAPGHAHCAACCYGTLVEEYARDCPIPKHRTMAERQHPVVASTALSDAAFASIELDRQDFESRMP